MGTEYGIGNAYFTLSDGNVVMEGGMDDFKTKKIELEENANNMEKFNLEKHWDDFQNSRLIVNCKTEDLAKEFLNYCQSKDFNWAFNRPTEINYWDKYKENTFYGGSDNHLWYNDISDYDHYFSERYTLVEFKGFVQNDLKIKTESNVPKETTKEIIEVIYHRKETIVLIKTNGKYYKGLSRCHNEDTYDKEQGFMIAYQRAKENQQKSNKSFAKQENLQENSNNISYETCRHNNFNSGKPCYDRWLKMKDVLNRYNCYEK